MAAAQTLDVLPLDFTVDHHGGPPTATPPGDWWAMSRTPEGTTVISAAERGSPPAERWRAFYNSAAHGLDLPGMLAAIVAPLADAGVPVFVSSTFQADLVLVPAARLAEAAAALREAGHLIVEQPGASVESPPTHGM